MVSTKFDIKISEQNPIHCKKFEPYQKSHVSNNLQKGNESIFNRVKFIIILEQAVEKYLRTSSYPKKGQLIILWVMYLKEW